jgi:hypothetical protein
VIAPHAGANAVSRSLGDLVGLEQLGKNRCDAGADLGRQLLWPSTSPFTHRSMSGTRVPLFEAEQCTREPVVSALIEEIEAAATAADTDAEQARMRVFDRTVIDAHKTHVALETAPSDVIVDRPRCSRERNVCRRCRRQSTPRGGSSEYKQVEVKCDELARTYAEYPKLVAQLVDLFGNAKAADKEILRINGSAPPADYRRLLAVELTARGLRSFSTADPPIAKGVQLPDWAHSVRMAWPPLRLFDPASFAPMPVDRRLSAEWGAGTRRRPRHAGVTGARSYRAGGHSAQGLTWPATVGRRARLIRPARRRMRGLGPPRISENWPLAGHFAEMV